MKRTLAWVLLFVMLLGMFAGCKKQEAEPPTTTAPTGEVVTASDAMEYVKAIYPNTEEPLKTAIDYERMGVVRISDIPFTVVWTTDLSEDLIKIVPREDGTVVTIDINEQCEADTPYVLTATITDEAGNVATHSWNCILPQAVDMVSLVEQAYALKNGESLPFECTLIGKIISIDKPFDPDYQNITVTIAVAGAENKPIQCYRLKGDGAKDLVVGNIITVTGTIKNYNGTIEFDAGCILEAVEKGDAVETPTDVGEILKAAYKLEKGKALPYPVTLTGVVTEIDSPYDPGYKNISVVIEMEGYSKYPILCYRMKGKDVENIAVGDTITVTGIIKNYEGTIEFDASCQMSKRVSGGGVALKPTSDQNKILRDAKKLKEGEKLAYIATLTGEVITVDSAYDSSYKNVTVTIVVAGTKIQCYRLKGDDASKVRVTDKITVTGQIENYYGKLEFGSGCTLDKWVKGSRVVKIDMGPLKEETAYKMEMKLPTLSKNVYFNGKISNSHYLQTGTYEEAVEVFMEKTEGKGVRFYFLDGETKTYIEIKMIDVTDKEGKTSKKARPQLATTANVYWTYSEDAGVYTVDIDGTKYYLGTYLNNGTVYETASCSSIYYITDSNAGNKGKTQFYFDFVTKASDAPDAPVEPETPTISGLPAYNAELKTGDKVVIYAPAYSKALSTEKIATYYNKGVDLTVKNNALSGYGNAETWTVTVNADGTVNFANDGKNIALGDDFSSMNLGEKHDDWQLISLGNGLYNIKNVGRGNIIEWYAEKNNWSTYGASDAATNKLFQLSIYVIDKGVLTQTADVPEQPDTPDTPEAPELPTEDGAVISIADAIAAGKAMAHDTYTELKYKVNGEIVEVYQTVYGNMRIKDADGNILTIYGTYSADGKTRYDAMEVKPVAGDTVTIYGPVGQFKDTPQIKNGWIVAHTPAGGSTPEQPPVTPDEPEEGISYVDAPVAGTAYKFVMNQAGLGKMLGFTGKMGNTYYFGTSEDVAEMVDVYLEEATGGYHIYFMNGETKTYLNVIPRTNDATKTNVVMQTLAENTAPSVYELNTEFKYVKTACVGADWYLGTYGSNTTISASKTSYIADTSKIGVSQFVTWFAAAGKTETPDTPVEPEDPKPEEPEEGISYVDAPVAGTAYKFVMNQAGLGKMLGFTGKMGNTYYFGTSEDVAEMVDVYLEEATGGYHIYFMNGETKTYLNVIPRTNDATKTNVVMQTLAENAAPSVYELNTEFKYVKTACVGADWYLGTYGSNTTISASKTSYIEDTSKIGVSQFVTWFAAAGKTETPDTPVEPEDPKPEEPEEGISYVDAPVAGTAYKFVMNQAGLGKMLGFTGKMGNTYYFGTSEDVAEMVDVYLEEATGGYHIYFMNGETKTYLNVIPRTNDATKTNVVMQTLAENAAPSVYELNTEFKYVKTACVGADWYLGTYGSNTTISASKTSYIADTSKIGVSQFVTWFAAAGKTETPDTPADESATISFADKANRTVYNTQQQVWVQNGITVTNDKAASTSNVADYANPARFYKSSKLTIAYEGMKKIVFNVAFADRVAALTDSLAGMAGVTVTVDDLIVTVELAEVTNTFVIETMANQTRIYEITVYGKSGAQAPETPEEPETPPVTPEEPETPAGESATITFDDLAKRTVLTDDQQVWVENGITITNDKAASTNKINGEYYDPIRLYKGTTLTIACDGMIKIEMDCNYSSYVQPFIDAVNALNDSNIESVTAATEGYVVTIVFKSAVNSITVPMSAAQVRAKTITVYKGAK